MQIPFLQGKGMKAKRGRRRRGAGSRQWKSSIVRDARRVFDSVLGGQINPAAACLYWSTILIIVAKSRGYESLILQAGNAHFKRVPDHMDDGVIPTHFSYVFEEDAILTKVALAGGGFMPEMHCWVADRRTKELADITTGHVPTQCTSLTGSDWLTPPPPAYVWGSSRVFEEKMPGCHYEALMSATVLANEYASNWANDTDVIDRMVRAIGAVSPVEVFRG